MDDSTLHVVSAWTDTGSTCEVIDRTFSSVENMTYYRVTSWQRKFDTRSVSPGKERCNERERLVTHQDGQQLRADRVLTHSLTLSTAVCHLSIWGEMLSALQTCSKSYL